MFAWLRLLSFSFPAIVHRSTRVVQVNIQHATVEAVPAFANKYPSMLTLRTKVPQRTSGEELPSSCRASPPRQPVLSTANAVRLPEAC